MNWLKTFIFGSKCGHCGVRGHLDNRTDGWKFYYWCRWCFKRSDK